MKTAWLSKNLILPLAPFLIGAIIRLFRADECDFECLNSGELAFAMAILFLVLTPKISNIQNNDSAKHTLTGMFHLASLVFIVLFSMAVVNEVDRSNAISEFSTECMTNSNNPEKLNERNQVDKLERTHLDLIDKLEKTHRASENIVIATIIVSCLSIWFIVRNFRQFELFEL